MIEIKVGRIFNLGNKAVCIFKEPINGVAIIAEQMDNEKVEFRGVRIEDLTDYTCSDTNKPCHFSADKSSCSVKLTCGLCRALPELKRLGIIEEVK